MKRKLRLQIEKLRVEQFAAHPDSTMERGTVQGYNSHSCNTNPWGGGCICFPVDKSWDNLCN